MTTKNFNYDLTLVEYQGQHITVFIKFKNKMIGCVTASNRLVLIDTLGRVTKAKPFKEGGIRHLPLVEDFVATHEIEWVEHEELAKDSSGYFIYDDEGEKVRKTTRFLPTIKAGTSASMVGFRQPTEAKSLRAA